MPDGTHLATGHEPLERNAMQHTYASADGVADCHFVQFVSQSISYTVGGQPRWHAGQIDVARRAAPVQLSAPGARHWYVDAPSDGTPFYDDNSLSRRTPTALPIFDKPKTSFDRLNEIADAHADVTIERMDVWWMFCTVLVKRVGQVFTPVVVTNWAVHTPAPMQHGFPDPGDSTVTEGEVMGGHGGWNQLQQTLLAQHPDSMALFGIASTHASKQAKAEAKDASSDQPPPRRDPPPPSSGGGSGKPAASTQAPSATMIDAN